MFYLRLLLVKKIIYKCNGELKYNNLYLYLYNSTIFTGDHFNKLGDKQDMSKQSSVPSQPKVVTAGGADMQVRSSTNPKQATAADEAKMQQILADPEIRDVLIDPQIQNLFEMLRNDPAKGQRLYMFF